MDISSMLEVQVDEVKEVDSKENVTPKDLLPTTIKTSSPISQEELNHYKFMYGTDISIVRFQRLHCTGCDIHIGSAPASAYNMFEHPILRTLLCASCREFYGDGTFEQGDDATDMFCRWCANGGNLYCCSFCSNTFCYKCIKRNIDPVLRKKIEADEQWKCFVCDPKDLYSARATCWALLEYIKKMNRFLQYNCKLSQQEIEEKMNLDEANCCPRRRKRKRRRTASNSEEDDRTYVPKQLGTPTATRGRRGRRRKLLNGNSNLTIAVQSFSGVEESSMDNHELLPSLLSCEQTMVEGENETVDIDGRVVSQQPRTILPRRIEPNIVPQPMYNTFVNVVAPNFLQPTSPMVPIRHVHNPINQMNLYQTMQCAQTPMVTIPNQSADMLNRLNFPLAQSQIPSKTTSSSNVIEIESDSEDVAIVGPSRNSRSFKDHIDNNKAVPIALVSSKSSNQVAKTLEIVERRNVKTLNQRLVPHGQEIDNILLNLKSKLQELFETVKNEEQKKYGLNDARVTIKQFHREIRDTVSQLACINDRIVREYNRWKRHQLKAGAIQPSERDKPVKKLKNEEIPLEMTCVNESASDTENSESENNIIKPSEFVGTTNVVGGIKSFKKRSTMSRAVGNDYISFIDKAVQIFDVELNDYDKCIRHSTLEKLDQGLETCKQSLSYEEQFIYYLQNRVDSDNIQSEESKNLPDPNETPLKDLIEANSPFISKMLEAMDKSVNSNDNDSKNKKTSNKEDDDLKPLIHQEMNSATDHSQKQAFVKTVNDITNDFDKKKGVKNASIPVINTQKEIKSYERRVSINDEIFIVNVSTKDSRNTSISKNTTSNKEDECTIISD